MLRIPYNQIYISANQPSIHPDIQPLTFSTHQTSHPFIETILCRHRDPFTALWSLSIGFIDAFIHMQCTMYYLLSTMYYVLFIMNYVSLTLYNVISTKYNVLYRCTMYYVLYTMYYLLCSMYHVLHAFILWYTMYYVLCAI